MNERIKELVEQTVGTNPKYAVAMIMSSPELQKFAELIVEDAVSILRQEWYDLNDAPSVEGETPRDIGLRVGAKSQTIRLMRKIKEHFGVEE